MKRVRPAGHPSRACPGAWRKAKPTVPDDPALVRTPRAREITNAQIVQSIIQRGIE